MSLPALAHIPAGDLETFAAYPSKVQSEILRLLPICKTIATAPAVVPAIEKAARDNGLSVGTVKRKYYAWRAHNWQGLVNRGALPARQRFDARISAEFVAEWRRRCENVQRRATRQAWGQLIRDLREGIHVPGLPPWTTLWAEDFPGDPIPPAMPLGWVPKGLVYWGLW